MVAPSMPAATARMAVDEGAIWTWRSRSAFRLTIGRAARIFDVGEVLSSGAGWLWYAVDGSDVVPA
jgi:hypothetical protein